MEIDQIKELMSKIESSKLKKIRLKKGDFELEIEKEGEHAVHAASIAHEIPSRHPPIAEGHAELYHKLEKTAKRSAETVVEGQFVVSPMVGTFFASAAPDEPPFVKVGDRVEPDTVVCIVEAMKVMNEVKANTSGVIAEILIENAHPVEFGSKVMRVV